jgi:hypothetical protein
MPKLLIMPSCLVRVANAAVEAYTTLSRRDETVMATNCRGLDRSRLLTLGGHGESRR